MDQEAVLAQRLADGDPEAFPLIFQQSWPSILGYALRRTGNYAVAEDIAAQTFVKAWESHPSFNFRGFSYRPWLVRIVHNLCSDHHRRSKLVREIENNEAERSDPMAEEQLNAVDWVPDISVASAAVSALTPYERRIVYLRFIADLSPTEVAGQLRKNVATIKVSQSRAIAKLRLALT